MNNPDTEDRRLQLSAKEIRLAADDIRKLRWIDREGALDRLAAFCDQRADEIAAVASAAPPESQMPNTPDTDWIKPGVQAVVTVAKIFTSCGLRWAELRVDDHATTTGIRLDCLSPLPPPLSPTAQRVVEAAMMEHQKSYYDSDGKNNSFGEWAVARDNLRSACREHAEHLATLRPADPLAVAMEALRDIVEYTHEHTIKSKARAAILLIERGGKGEG